MEHMEQLKRIRSDAIARIRTSPDFKLAGKLGLLIVELGDTVEDSVEFDEPEETSSKSLSASVGSLATPLAAAATTTRPFEAPFLSAENDDTTELTSDEMIEELVAEIEGDAAELDAIMAEQNSEEDEKEEVMEEEDLTTVGPFLKPDVVESNYTNGSTH